MRDTGPPSAWLPASRDNLAVHTANGVNLTVQLAQDIAQRLAAAIQMRGFAVLCVSGGKSPVALFEALRTRSIDWPLVRVTLADERCVPCTHPASNALLVRTSLLQDNARAAQFVPMITETVAPLSPPSVQAKAAGIALSAAGIADVLVLGMGEDGHTAALFPDAPNLHDALDMHNTDVCVAIELAHPPANAPFPRVTQTLAQLLRARHILLPLSGAEKLTALRQALVGVNDRHPISYVLNQTQTPIALWIAT